jgi:quercetin dioxygenase-like cupin family protein
MKVLTLAAIVAACGHAPPPPSPSPSPSPSQTPSPTPTPTPSPSPTPEPKGPSQDEILAAIQKAMNDLEPPAHGCWAAAATERFDVEGELKMHVDVGDGTAIAMVAHDTSNSKRLGSCMTALLTSYRWAPPLKNQSIELPFKFTAPDGQSVIDRRLVEAHAQGGVAVSVLLDENNTGNPNASMLEVAIQAGASTSNRWTDRAEVWYFLAPAHVTLGLDEHAALTAPQEHDVAAGDIVYVPPGNTMKAAAKGGDTRAVVVVVPGGREGTARAGALTNAGKGLDRKLSPAPRVVAASAAKTYGPATIYLDPVQTLDHTLAASILQLPAGAKVPEHVHAKETELLYVLAGAGTMTIAGTDLPVTATSVIQIPPNTKHAFAATEAVRAVQIYTPAGPEQRFKKPPPK